MKARIPNAPSQGNMMKQIQKMQEDMERIQAEVEASEYTASVGGGAEQAAKANMSIRIASNNVKSFNFFIQNSLSFLNFYINS